MYIIVSALIAVMLGLFTTEVSAYNGTIDMTLVTFPTSMFETVTALILVALAVLWIMRKVMSLTRS